MSGLNTWPNINFCTTKQTYHAKIFTVFQQSAIGQIYRQSILKFTALLCCRSVNAFQRINVLMDYPLNLSLHIKLGKRKMIQIRRA